MNRASIQWMIIRVDIALHCYKLLLMTLDELRRELHNICMDAGGVKPWASGKGIAFSYVAGVIRGDKKPGKKILKAMELRKSFSLRKDAVMKFEDITN